MLMFMGAPAMAATALAGEPLARKPIPGPLLRPKSMLPETSPCCSLASPAKPVTSSASPRRAKMPASMPTSMGVNVQAKGTALPTRTVSAAASVSVTMDRATQRAGAEQAMHHSAFPSPLFICNSFNVWMTLDVWMTFGLAMLATRRVPGLEEPAKLRFPHCRRQSRCCQEQLMTDHPSFRQALNRAVAERRLLVVPGAYDALSALLIERAGFDTMFIGGFPVAGARYGVPDIGLKGFADIAGAVRDIIAACDVPVLVDIDDGYGDVKNAVHTVQSYERMGASAVFLEDQAW